ARHAAGHEHRPRRQPADDSRQQPARRALPARHDGRHGESEPAGARRAPADRLGGEPDHPGDAVVRRQPARHRDLRNHRHGGRSDHRTGSVPLRAQWGVAGGEDPRAVPRLRHPAEVKREAGHLGISPADGNVRAGRVRALMAIVLVATFVTVLAFVLCAYWLFVARHEASEHRAIQKRLRPQEDAARKRGLTIAKSEQRDSGGMAFRRLQSVVDQSGLRLTVAGLLCLCAMSGTIVALIVWTFVPKPALASAAGALALAAPYWLVRRAANARMWKFEEQFPEAIDLIARALRAGHAFPTGLA